MRRDYGVAVVSCALASLLAGSCSYSAAPADDVEFADLHDLRQLDGGYRNRGVSAPDAANPVFLSTVVFPSAAALDHEAIDIIDVRARDASTLVVKAIDARGNTVATAEYVEGQDFALRNGRVRLRREGALLGAAPDDPLVGPRKETVEIGLDLRRAGKYRRSFSGAGLVYLLVPVAIRDTEDVRFERVAD